MESSRANEGNSGFGFNDINFSDRVLRLEITPVLASNMNSGGKKYLHWFSSPDGASKSGCVGTNFIVKMLHINSLVLALKSPVFHKLFKGGMTKSQSQQRAELTFRINASEEAALVDLLKFIYGYPLKATSMPDLVNVLIAADKFEVTSCIQHCVELLLEFPLELPLSMESVIFYLELPSSVSEHENIQPLIREAKKHVAAHFINLTDRMSNSEAMALLLSALEAVLASNGLQVESEDAVFDFILSWARRHYPQLEERQEILSKLLVPFVCLPNMSSWKLRYEMLDNPDLDSKELLKLMLKALLSKGQVLAKNTKYCFPRRAYKCRLIKVVELEFAQPRCLVFLNLEKQEYADLYPSKRLYSQTFYLGRHNLCLYAEHSREKRAFGLFVATTDGSETCTLDFEFAVMEKSSKEFTSLAKKENRVIVHKRYASPDMFQMPWKDLMDDESKYFIDGILHLRADLTICE